MRALEELGADSLGLLALLVTDDTEGAAVRQAPAFVTWLADAVAHEQARRDNRAGEERDEAPFPVLSPEDIEAGALVMTIVTDIPRAAPIVAGRELTEAETAQLSELRAFAQELSNDLLVMLTNRIEEQVH